MLRLRRCRDEAVIDTALAPADMGALVGRDPRRTVPVPQELARFDNDRLAVGDGGVGTVIIEPGAGRAAITLAVCTGAVAARIAGVGLLEIFVPIVILGMADVVAAFLGAASVRPCGEEQPRASGYEEPVHDLELAHDDLQTCPALASAEACFARQSASTGGCR